MAPAYQEFQRPKDSDIKGYEDIHKGDAAFVHVLQKHLTQVVLEIISDEPNGGGRPRDPTRYLQSDPSIEWHAKLIAGAIYGGLGILFISVLRQRLIERKTDKYKDVEI